MKTHYQHLRPPWPDFISSGRSSGPQVFIPLASHFRASTLLSTMHTLLVNSAPPGGICSSITESRHITAVKRPWRRSNRYEALGQMLLINQRLDKLAAARVDYVRRGMLAASHDAPPVRLKVTPEETMKRRVRKGQWMSSSLAMLCLHAVEVLVSS